MKAGRFFNYKEGMIVAEIKSTLDLVLEKTRNMSLTSEEKKQLDEEAAMKRARGLFQKYVDGVCGLRELEEYVKQGTESNPEKTRRHISLFMIESLAPGMAENIHLEGLKAWLGPKADSEIDSAAVILDWYREEVSKLHEEIENKLKIDLEQRGIRGSAVKAKVTEDKQWRARKEELKQEAERRLENIKDNLKKLV